MSRPTICPRCFYHHPHRAVSTRPLQPDLGKWVTEQNRARSFATPWEAEAFACAEFRYKLKQELKHPELMSVGLLFEVLAKYGEKPALVQVLRDRDLDDDQIKAGIESARAEIKEAQR